MQMVPKNQPHRRLESAEVQYVVEGNGIIVIRKVCSVGRHIIFPHNSVILSIIRFIPCINSRWTPSRERRHVKGKTTKDRTAAIATATIDPRSRHRTSCCLCCTHLDLGAQIAPAQRPHGAFWPVRCSGPQDQLYHLPRKRKC